MIIKIIATTTTATTGQSQKTLQSRAGVHFGVFPLTGTLLARITQAVIGEYLETYCWFLYINVIFYFFFL